MYLKISKQIRDNWEPSETSVSKIKALKKPSSQARLWIMHVM